VDELILRTIVIQFDGQVVEVFGAPVGEVVRHHVALVEPPDIGAADRRGRTRVSIGRASFTVGSDEMRRLGPLLDKIGAAVREARPGAS
jgi:hypothetical protein